MKGDGMSPKPPYFEGFAERLKALMIRCGVSPTELGKRTGAKPATVSGWRSGEVCPPAARLHQIARALSIDYRELTGEPIQASATRPGAPADAGLTLRGNFETMTPADCRMLSAPVLSRGIQCIVPGTWGELMVDVAAVPHAVFAVQVLDESLAPMAGRYAKLIVDKARIADPGDLALADISVGEQTPICRVGYLYEHRGRWQLNDVASDGPPTMVADRAKAWKVLAIVPGQRPPPAAKAAVRTYAQGAEHLPAVADDEQPPTEAEAADDRDQAAELKTEAEDGDG